MLLFRVLSITEINCYRPTIVSHVTNYSIYALGAGLIPGYADIRAGSPVNEHDGRRINRYRRLYFAAHTGDQQPSGAVPRSTDKHRAIARLPRASRENPETASKLRRSV